MWLANCALVGITLSSLYMAATLSRYKKAFIILEQVRARIQEELDSAIKRERALQARCKRLETDLSYRIVGKPDL